MEEGDTERNPAQDKKLTSGEIKKLKEAGIDPEQLKKDIMGGDKSSPFDLYKDTQGNIYVKLKGGLSLGELTGLNINDL